MKIRYYTKKGSVYIQTICDEGEYWVKEDADGTLHSLVSGLHISRARLQELVHEYPSTLLDKTYCFEFGVEKEFFEDAKREKFSGMMEAEETVIFFLVKHEDRYAIGCSSEVMKIEKKENNVQ